MTFLGKAVPNRKRMVIIGLVFINKHYFWFFGSYFFDVAAWGLAAPRPPRKHDRGEDVSPACQNFMLAFSRVDPECGGGETPAFTPP